MCTKATRCSRQKNSIAFGWKADTNTANYGMPVALEIFGSNKSSVDVKDFRIKWKEIVSYRTDNQSVGQELERVIAIAHACIRDEALQWKAVAKQGKEKPSQTNHDVVRCKLWLPPRNYQEGGDGSLYEAAVRESYQVGGLVSVRHEITVGVCQTAKDLTTNPKVSSPVNFVQQLPRLTATRVGEANNIPVARAVPVNVSHGYAPMAVSTGTDSDYPVPIVMAFTDSGENEALLRAGTTEPESRPLGNTSVVVEDASDSENEGHVSAAALRRNMRPSKGESWMEPV
eukprot:scaffold469_cov160-Amphora_coffeaeformis.AAC.2